MVPINTLPGLQNGRAMAMTHLAMFNAVNCVEPKYQGYGMTPEPSPDTSQEAAAASAAGNLLIKLVPKNKTLPTQLQDYLAKIPDSPAKQRGVKLGEEVADKIVKLRDGDGTERTKNGFRPVTQPGVYTATLFQYGWEASGIKPMALTSAQQFRPGPYPDLKSETWTKDYNEIKELGERNSTKRTAQQTEDARFWLTQRPHSDPSDIAPDSAGQKHVGGGQHASWRLWRWRSSMPAWPSLKQNGTTCSGGR
jgi:hypothetical protein